MREYVIDASVAIKWHVPEPHVDAALRLLSPDHRLHAPDLLRAETGNILWKKVRRGEMTEAEAREIARAILDKSMSIHPSAYLLQGALKIGLDAGCSVYDGLYVALALGLEAPLVTADRRLVEALGRTPWRAHVVWVEDVA